MKSVSWRGLDGMPRGLMSVHLRHTHPKANAEK
jgi:hypothetical protein